jgi:hypothetical protein
MKIISTSIYDVAVVIELVQLLKMSGKQWNNWSKHWTAGGSELWTVTQGKQRQALALCMKASWILA